MADSGRVIGECYLCGHLNGTHSIYCKRSESFNQPREYWRINSREVGRGPLWEKKEDAENERDEMLEGDPDDEVTVSAETMTPAQYKVLPEFEGY